MDLNLLRKLDFCSQGVNHGEFLLLDPCIGIAIVRRGKFHFGFVQKENLRLFNQPKSLPEPKTY